MDHPPRSRRVIAAGRADPRLPFCAALLLAAACLAGIGCTPSGLRSLCGPYEDMKFRAALQARAELEGRRVWNERFAPRYDELPAVTDLRQGFIQAYVETALGRDGCPPPIPESPLLSWNTLTHSYPNANRWYEGYHLGHATATSRGVDRWRHAPLDPQLFAAAHRGSHEHCVPCGSGEVVLPADATGSEADAVPEEFESVAPPPRSEVMPDSEPPNVDEPPSVNLPQDLEPPPTLEAPGGDSGNSERDPAVGSALPWPEQPAPAGASAGVPQDNEESSGGTPRWSRFLSRIGSNFGHP